ncbi:MAG: hypothetical protein CML33_02835 [Rhodobacteraceae bacterium]|nr:hypothetical protein [Paracoccaceae bacterium]
MTIWLGYFVASLDRNTIGIFAVTNDNPEFETGVTSYNLDLVYRLRKRFPSTKFTIYLSKNNSERFSCVKSENVRVEIVPDFRQLKPRAIHLLFQKELEWNFFSKIESLHAHKLVIYTVFGLFPYFPAYCYHAHGGRCISAIHDIRFLFQGRKLPFSYIRRKLHDKFFRSILRSSELLLLPSNHAVKTLNSLFRSNKYRVSFSVPIKEDVPAPASSLYGDCGDTFFFFPATAVETKNHVVLIKAMEMLVTEYPSVRLILTGSNFESTYGRKIKSTIAAADLKQNIIYLGFVGEAEKQWLFKNALAAVFPTKNESFNLGIWEAFSYRCPVVTSTDPEMVEQVGKAGFLAEVDSPQSLHRAMKLIIENPDISEELVTHGDQRIKSVRDGALLSGWGESLDQ